MDNKNIINNTRGTTARNTLKALGSPKAIQLQNQLVVLIWLYRWGFSTGEMISDLLGRTNRSHARRMAKDGWIQAVSIKGYPTYFVLTERGLNEAIRHSNDLWEYKEIDPYRVHLPTLHHYLIAQRETVHVLRNNIFSDYKTERMYKFKGDSALSKIPDVLFIKKEEDLVEYEVADQYIAIEIELTPKWNFHLDMFVTNIVSDIQESRIQRCIIISDSPAILSRYQAAFEAGTVVKLWEKGSGGTATNTSETLTLPSWIPKFIFFRKSRSSEPYPS
ncbi:MAG: hypothetical protein HYZ46_04330 [Nitrosomonadales bacterium]|nr:hypothetical protein [Nitrosomonadales bacterium]